MTREPTDLTDASLQSRIPVPTGDSAITPEQVISPLLTGFVKSPTESEWILGFMQSTPDCAILVGPGGVIVAVNDQSHALFGYVPEELVGQSIELLVPDRFAATHPRKVADFFRSPRPVAIGVRRNLSGRHKNGKEIPVEIGLTPIRLEENTLVLAMVRDISSRVHTAERLRLLVEAAPTAMVMVDQKGIAVMVNAKAESVFGYERKELIGMPINRLIPERYREKHTQQVASFFMDPTPREMGVGREVFGLRKDGSEFPLELALGSITLESEVFALATLVDISQRRRIEKELTAAREIQQSLLPREAPRVFGFDIAGICDPAFETGGDFFDYVKLPSANMAVIVGDVCGHGFGPALRAATAQYSLRTLLRTGVDLVQAVSDTNELLLDECHEAQLITLAALELFPQTGSAVFCGAGHDAYVFDRSGQIKHYLDSGGPMLGMDTAEFEASDQIQLAPGELVLVVTDGTFEALSPTGEAFGKQRLFDIIKTSQRSRANEIVDSLRTAITDFCGGLPQHDDVTIVVVKVRD